MAELKITDQAFEVTIPNGTAAGTPITSEFNFRTDFTKCTGYVLHQVSNPNGIAASVRIELDNGAIISDYVHFKHIEANAATPMGDRYKPADFRSMSEKVRIIVKPITASGAVDIILQLVFRLVK